MGYSCGILGLPNVGKSTLFNALTRMEIESSNYPFCTIEPNKGKVVVPDKRLDKIVEWIQPKSVVPSVIDFIDIAGIVEGASRGLGLGNQFLSQIQDVEALAQVVRLFKNPDITHLGKDNPVDDVRLILSELRLKDLQVLETRQKNLEKELKSGKKNITKELESVLAIKSLLEEEKPISNLKLSDEEHHLIKNCRLIMTKPMFIIGNIDENLLHNYQKDPHYLELLEYLNKENLDLLCICAKVEAELNSLNEHELKEWLDNLNIKENALHLLIREGYKKLNLRSFFTVGVKESKQWTIYNGTRAKEAARKIHSDIERGFISVEQISFSHFEAYKGNLKKIKEEGFLKIQGKDYLVEDADILNFRFQV